jgi:malate permease and related proteins
MLPVVISVFYTVLQIAIPVAIGFIFRKVHSITDRDYQVFSRLVISVTLPLYFIVRISRIDLNALIDVVWLPVAAVVVVGGGLLIARLLAPALIPNEDHRGIFSALAGFGNSGYLPLSINELLPLTLPALAPLVGSDEATLMIGAYLFVQSILLWSVGNALVVGLGPRPSFRQFLSPAVVGMLIGLALRISGFTTIIERPGTFFYYTFFALEQVSSLTVPLVLITVGGLIAGINRSVLKDHSIKKYAISVTVMRMLVVPALFWTFALVFRKAAMTTVPLLWVLFLETHTPPASNLSIMAARANKSQSEVAAAILVSYLSYLVIFPVYLTMFLLYIGV